MKNLFILFLLSTGFLPVAMGQKTPIDGKVTFVTSRNVYVSFEKTEQIIPGDTLFLSNDSGKIPCLVVDQKSSSSCVSHVIGDCKPSKGDALVHYGIPPKPEKRAKRVSTQETSTDSIQRKQRIRSRVSAGSYSTLSNVRDAKHRAMYRVSLNADNIADSKFSAETYVAYRQLFLPPEEAARKKTGFLNIYNLALKYEASPTLTLSAGRKINDKVSSLGAVDGLQAEKYFGNWFTGAIGGFRPDLSTHGFNSNLLQYGAYAGWEQNKPKFYSRTTLGALQQTNAGAVDRRYLYAQHSSSINYKLNIFASAELDLFNELDGQRVSDPRITNLYVSARYRFSRRLNFNLSYDSRKRVLYYETFRTDVTRILAEDQTRHGIRARFYYRPLKYTFVGGGYSTRFQTNNGNPSDNYNAYITRSNVPGMGGRLSLTVNRNESAYATNQSVSVRHYRDLIRRKLSLNLYFRMVEYEYRPTEAIIRSNANSIQYYGGGSINYRIRTNLSCSVLGEYATRSTEQTYRINARLIQRFDTKRKRK